MIYQQANDVIDQLYSYSPAINALNELAAYKIVLGGGETEEYEFLAETSNRPLYNIMSGKNNLKSVMDHLMTNKMNFEQIGIVGYEFVEKHFCHIKLAKQYLELWRKNS